MKTRFYRTIVAFLVMIFSGVGIMSSKSYELKVGEFNRLKVTDSINVVYRCTSPGNSSGMAEFTSKPEYADAFIFTNNNGELKVQVSTDFVDAPDFPVLYLTSDFLSTVTNEGLGTITVESLAPCAEFKVRVVGNGKVIAKGVKSNVCSASLDTGCGSIILEGDSRIAKFKLVGTGVIQADLLKTQTVECNIMGSGSIGCFPEEKLSVRGIGSTKIYYKGNPTDVKKRGGGKLIQLAD